MSNRRMSLPPDMTKREASCWIAREIRNCTTPDQRIERANIERAALQRYEQLGFDRFIPRACAAQRTLIAALEE